jgi:outer membrane protein assembly factor BamB
MMDDWGWMDGVPYEAGKPYYNQDTWPTHPNIGNRVEIARYLQDGLTGAELDTYIDNFLATLTPDELATYGDWARERITLGTDDLGNAPGWTAMYVLDSAGAVDVEYPTWGVFQTIEYAGYRFEDGSMCDGHGDKGAGGNFILHYLMGIIDNNDSTYCLDAADGSLLWKKNYLGAAESRFHWNWYAGVSSTPTVVNDKVYTQGTAGIYCLSVVDGSEIWTAATTFSNSSPLVADGRVYVLYGNNRDEIPGELTAYDAGTGSVEWTQPAVRCLYSSPAWWSDGTNNALICLAKNGPFLVDPATGNVLSQITGTGSVGKWQSDYSTPAVSGNKFVCSIGHAVVVYEITYPNISVSWDASIPGKPRGCSLSIYNGYVYGFAKYASCWDLGTGALQWSEDVVSLSMGESPSPVIADGKAYSYSKAHWTGSKYMHMYELSPACPIWLDSANHKFFCEFS